MTRGIMRYKQEYDGQWIRPIKKGYKMACCDCGLVHRVEFAHVPYGSGRKIILRAWRDNRATAAMRRKKSKGEKGG